MSHMPNPTERKTSSLSWENAVRIAAKTPHVAQMVQTNTGSIMVAGHLSRLSWLGAVEENSAAWAQLIIQGLVSTGNSGELVSKVPMRSYEVAKSPKCPKPKTLDIQTIAAYEAISERVVFQAIAEMKK